MLDLFSGTGGAGAAFRSAGWRVVGVDIDPETRPDIVADVLSWSWNGERPAFVWASPPCEDFTRRFLPWIAAKHPGPPALALALVEAAWRIIRETGTPMWAVENVRGAIRWLGSPDQTAGPFMLWTNLPPLGLGGFRTLDQRKEHMTSAARKRRAAVPLLLSEALLRAVEDVLESRSEVTSYDVTRGPGTRW